MFDQQIKMPDGTVHAVLSDGSTIRAQVPVYAGGRLDALRLAPFRAGEKLVVGKRYLVRPGHVVRCLEGARGPYVPASDGQALDGDGSDAVVARVAALIIDECHDEEASATILNLHRPTRS